VGQRELDHRVVVPVGTKQGELVTGLQVQGPGERAVVLVRLRGAPIFHALRKQRFGLKQGREVELPFAQATQPLAAFIGLEQALDLVAGRQDAWLDFTQRAQQQSGVEFSVGFGEHRGGRDAQVLAALAAVEAQLHRVGIGPVGQFGEDAPLHALDARDAVVTLGVLDEIGDIEVGGHAGLAFALRCR
jgi:hypothetical protein